MEVVRPHLSLVVPAFNEERRLGPMLAAYLPHLERRYGNRVEVLVVVNGSTDRTADVARSFQSRHPFLVVREEPRPIGKGGAVMRGFSEAKGERIAYVDADGATPPEALVRLVEPLDGADLVLASRWRPDSRITPQPWSRRVASRVFNAMVRILFRLSISDTQCGAKAMRREVVETILPRLGITAWAFDVDLLFQARRAGFRIVEAPTVWNDVAGSRLKLPRASVEMFFALLRLRLTYSRLRGLIALYDRISGSGRNNTL